MKEKIKNPIKPVGLFATPNSMEQFQDYLARFNGSEGVVAQTAAGMAWNLASKYVQEMIDQLEAA